MFGHFGVKSHDPAIYEKTHMKAFADYFHTLKP